MEFFLDSEILYKRRQDNIALLRCVDKEEADRILKEVHEGVSTAHAKGHHLARLIARVGYY